MKQFGLATNTVQWMTSIYLLVISVIVPLSAVLKSSFKTKQLFVTVNLLFFFFSGLLFDALAPNFAILLLGWCYVFFFLMPLIILSFFLGLYSIQQKSKIVKIKPDFLSIVFIAVLFAGVIYDFSNLSSSKLLINLFPIFIGLCSLGFLLVWLPCQLALSGP